MKKRIFIADDEPKLGDLYVTVLRRHGYEAEAFVDPTRMFEQLDAGCRPDVIMADMMMPEMNGIELLEALKQRNLNVPVIIMTAFSSVKTAVEAMRLGAFHYLQKPVNLEEMRTLLDKAIALYDPARGQDARVPAERAERAVRAGSPSGGARAAQHTPPMLGTSDAIERVRETIRTLKNVPNTIVLISGETGTGKNLVAKTIHYNSTYNAGRFMEINCAALPDNLLEAELFGYEKGAFTDAREAKPGLLEVADGGTVFLDEIDSMSAALQAKLLSFLESRTFRRLGGVEDMRVTTRILCATNANLEDRVAAKAFRKDLYFRINVVNIYMPALRQMGGDVLAMARAIVREFNEELGREVEGFTAEAEARLLAHAWPGNVRELRNVIERTMILTQRPFIDACDLTFSPAGAMHAPLYDHPGLHPTGDGAPVEARAETPAVTPGKRLFHFEVGCTLEDLEKAYILQTLRTVGGNLNEISDVLGISKKTLWVKRKRYNLDALLGQTLRA